MSSRYLEIILFITIVLAGYTIYIVKERSEDKVWKLHSTLLEARYRLFDMKEKQLYKLETEGLLLPDSVKEKITPNTCVVRLHNDMCLSCYAENLSKLVQRVIEMDSLELLILGSYTYNSALKDELSVISSANLNFINFPSLVIMPADSLGQPYLFVLDERKMINNLFFFQKEDMESVDKYLHNLLRLRNGK